MPAVGFSGWPALCLRLPPPVYHRRHHLGRRVDVDLYLPLLLVCDCHSGAGSGVDQGSFLRHEVVHLKNPLLELVWKEKKMLCIGQFVLFVIVPVFDSILVLCVE